MTVPGAHASNVRHGLKIGSRESEINMDPLKLH